jgi:hypothetical protein
VAIALFALYGKACSWPIVTVVNLVLAPVDVALMPAFMKLGLLILGGGSKFSFDLVLSVRPPLRRPYPPPPPPLPARLLLPRPASPPVSLLAAAASVSPPRPHARTHAHAGMHMCGATRAPTPRSSARGCVRVPVWASVCAGPGGELLRRPGPVRMAPVLWRGRVGVAGARRHILAAARHAAGRRIHHSPPEVGGAKAVAHTRSRPGVRSGPCAHACSTPVAALLYHNSTHSIHSMHTRHGGAFAGRNGGGRGRVARHMQR